MANCSSTSLSDARRRGTSLGVLAKLPLARHVPRSWKQREFVIVDNTLLFYKPCSDDMAHPNGAFALTADTSVRVVGGEDPDSTCLSALYDRERDFELHVSGGGAGGGRVFCMRARDRTARDDCMRVIEQHIAAIAARGADAEHSADSADA